MAKTVFPTKGWQWPAVGVVAPAPGTENWIEANHRAAEMLGDLSTHTLIPNGDYDQLRRDRDELVAALEAALALADDLASAYHDEGFEGACKGGTGNYANCPNCQERPGPMRATLARIKAGR